MKLSIKILLGTFLLMISGLVYTNSQLKTEYDKIDITDAYQEFNHESDLEFKHIHIDGGNESLIEIKKGESNTIYVYKEYAQYVEYSIQNDTLYVNLDENLTRLESVERYAYGSYFPDVIIEYKHIESLHANNSRIEFNYNNESALSIESSGYDYLNIMTENEGINELSINARNHSLISFNQSELMCNIKTMNLNLYDESFADLSNLIADSIALNMDETSNIKCGPSQLKQLFK